MFHTFLKSPVGRLVLRSDGEFLTGLYILGEHDTDWLPESEESNSAIPFAETIKQLSEYFEGQRSDFDLPLRLHGTEFQRTVWQALQDIPFATTISYGELSQRIGNPKAVRAVGGANGRNPVSIIVPCHRVIGANGSLTGYGGGIKAKSALLTLEARANLTASDNKESLVAR